MRSCVAKLLVDSFNFHINDYTLLTSVYGIKIDGIIGYSFLSRYTVTINYDTHIIEVWNQGEFKYPKAGLKVRPAINNIPIFESALRDATYIKSRFFLDTGAGLCVLLSEKFIKDSSLLQKGNKIIYTQAEGIGGKKQMRVTTIKEVRIGPYRFRKVPTFIFDDDYNVTNYPQLAGLIGNDILRRFNLIISYTDRIIHLTPNKHYSEPFDYSYTGMAMYLVDDRIVIEDIVEGSPAEKAGFLPGDVVLSVGTNFSGNIQTYKTLLQTPGATFKVAIKRNSELMILTIKVANILGKMK